MSRIVQANDEAIAEAAGILKSGGLVAMPTETVYGLAGNALDGAAVARIYEAKGRPAFNPLIAHFHSLEQVLDYVDLSASSPATKDLNYIKLNEGGRGEGPEAGAGAGAASGAGADTGAGGVLEDMVKALAAAFWPGPLTLVLPRRAESGISELATAGLDTIAVRVPAHKVAQALLKAMDGPLVAPSANKSGSLSPTTPAHVADSLGAAVDMILAGGPCAVGLESTVLDLTGEVPVILRPGAVTAEEICRVLGMPPHNFTPPHPNPLPGGERGYQVKAPGMLLKHYAPDTPLRLNAIDLEPGEALLAFGPIQFMGIKGGGAAKNLPEEMIRNLSADGDMHEAAANLFAMLKALDQAGAQRIAVMAVPETGLGVAINDRLKRAAA